ncbi:hypothetical protein AAFF_G00140130 [Aldrovandia affinis]|uniref:Uncharacterized protein n=1 Tax=Aldrovandia affinis TaxID=143900 RepID=A0AAD7X3Y9_9TELE|nr:hypothetical protein AAFF_G00140130 [Aldrovandia affinis]
MSEKTGQTVGHRALIHTVVAVLRTESTLFLLRWLGRASLETRTELASLVCALCWHNRHTRCEAPLPGGDSTGIGTPAAWQPPPPTSPAVGLRDAQRSPARRGRADSPLPGAARPGTCPSSPARLQLGGCPSLPSPAAAEAMRGS